MWHPTGLPGRTAHGRNHQLILHAMNARNLRTNLSGNCALPGRIDAAQQDSSPVSVLDFDIVAGEADGSQCSRDRFGNVLIAASPWLDGGYVPDR